MPSTQRKDWRDLDLAFVAHPVTKDVSVKVGVHAVFQQLEVLMSLGESDMPFSPNLGYDVSDLLFRNYSDVVDRTVRRTIQLVVEQHAERVELVEVKTDFDGGRKALKVEITVKDRVDGRTYTYTRYIRRVA